MPNFSEIPDSLQRRVDRSHDILREAVAAGPAPAFSTSLGAEDQVLLDLISRSGFAVHVFTLDTGRLHPETHALLAETEACFRHRIQVYFPNQGAVEDYVRINGINGFYESRAQRLRCCDVRKLEPLRRALHGKTAWITGLCRGQSSSRSEVVELEMDSTWGLLKANPLAAWTQDDVWTYLRAYEIPLNPLHERGYPSIGCAPCTREIGLGEDIRAGRWWWENDEKKECGIHVRPS